MYRKYPWYNTDICTKLNGQSFEDYFKTGQKDRCAFLCSVDTYDKYHAPIPNGASSGGRRPIPSTSS